jgi:uncharacterized membrane protein YfcA
MDPAAILGGFVVGAIVGVTGVGGGSLMTPLLLTVFRLSSAVAIGTDLWFAAITKSAGSVAHHRAGHVHWQITALLLLGSVPAALATIAVLHFSSSSRDWTGTLTVALGIALLLTAATVACRRAWSALGLRLERWLPARRRAQATVLCGVALGIVVTLSSIGAGAIGATLIMLLYPRLEAQRVVGTDIAHAVPLTLVAGIGHALLGHVDWTLLGALLCGSIPGIWLGARLTRRMPEGLVRVLLCSALVGAALKVIA